MHECIPRCALVASAAREAEQQQQQQQQQQQPTSAGRTSEATAEAAQAAQATAKAAQAIPDAGGSRRSLKRNISEVSNGSDIVIVGEGSSPRTQECLLCGHSSDERDPVDPTATRRWAFYHNTKVQLEESGLEPQGLVCLYCDRVKSRRFPGLSFKELLGFLDTDSQMRNEFNETLETTYTLMRRTRGSQSG